MKCINKIYFKTELLPEIEMDNKRIEGLIQQIVCGS